MIAIHTDIFNATLIPDCESRARQSGFQTFGEALRAEAAAFGEPILLAYSDSPTFKQSKPFPVGAPNLMAPQVHRT